MSFSSLFNNQLIFFTWVTVIGLIISLTEASIKIRYENYNNYKRRKEMISRLYPKKLI